jgi:hypothetical protein
MKKVIKVLIAVLVFVCAPLLMNNVFADQPPDPGGGPGGGDDPVGGGSPIGGGLIIMAAMGATYGARKLYDARKRLQ